MPAPVWNLLANAVQRFGERTAVVEGERVLSYSAFGAEVEALALRLAHDGLAAGDRLAMLDENSGSYLEAYFAAARLGLVLQPVNHRLAPPEMAAAFADAGTRALLHGERFAATVAELRQAETPVELWLAARVGLPAGEGTPPEAGVNAGDACHLYYTSGTTGAPRGVILTHRNVVAHATAAVDELELTAEDRWAHVAPLFHLADAWATFALTLVGGTHVVCPRFEPARVLELIARERVTLTNVVPTMLQRLVEEQEARPRDVSSLRLLLSGGAPIAPALVARVMQAFGCEYAQTYGMTETSPYLTLSLLDDELRALPLEEQLRYRSRTGRAFGPVELEVVDEAGRPVPSDDETVGEIRVRGATVTPGYWGRPEETAAAIRDGWLYTGDLAVIDERGFVDIVDRKKDMILTGGENVYSIEVENALYEHPDVLEVAVFGVPEPEWGEAVHAAVAPRPGVTLQAVELQAFCRARLAGYKTPRVIEISSELPKTGSGKIAKALLRERARAATPYGGRRPPAAPG